MRNKRKNLFVPDGSRAGLALVLLFVLLFPALSQADEMTMSTYYTSPLGAYDRVRLVPKAAGTDYTGSCAGQEGTMFVNSVGVMQFCKSDGTWGDLSVGSGMPFEQNGDYIYATDYGNPNLRVGIGTDLPQARLHIHDINTVVDWDSLGVKGHVIVSEADPALQLIGDDDSYGQSEVKFTDIAPITGTFNDQWIIGRTATTGGGGEFFFSYVDANDINYWFEPTVRRLAFFQDGKVGIGAFNQYAANYPQADLHIKSDATLMLESSFPYLELHSRSTNDENLRAQFKIGVKDNDRLCFWEEDSGVWTSRMTLSAQGNLYLGPGEVSAPFRLTLNGDGGILAVGTYNSGQDLVNMNDNARFIWHPKAASFRTGFFTASPWGAGAYSVGMGYKPTAVFGAVALGAEATASGTTSVAIGHQVTASNEDNLALGYQTTASGQRTVAMGRETQAVGTLATAMGYLTTANGPASMTMGKSTVADGGGWYATATGEGTTASNEAFAMGKLTRAIGQQSWAAGYGIQVTGTRSIGFGLNASQGSTVLSQASTMAIMGGRVGIGTVSPNSPLAVKGLTELTSGINDLRWSQSTGDFYIIASSRRFKDNIKPLADDFSKIMAAQPVSFVNKESGQPAIGLIAEDIDALGLKNLVFYRDDGLVEGVQYNRISLYLLDIIQERQRTIERLETQAARLKMLVCADQPEAELCP